jgi:uncharacterized protein (TIGR02453 family)
MSSTSALPGPGYFRFLRELKAHNEREWFQTNKTRYEMEVLRPMLALIAALQPPMRRLSATVKVDPKPVGGSLFRIYRDTRFSKDKRPYKTDMAARFPVVRGKRVYRLGFYLSFGAEGNYLAGGAWQPEADELRRIRDRIAADPAQWQKAVGGPRFSRGFSGGEGDDQLKRVPAPYPADHPCADDLRRKSFIVVASLTEGQATGAGLAGRVVGIYRQMLPMVRFLAAALKVEL